MQLNDKNEFAVRFSEVMLSYFCHSGEEIVDIFF